MASRRRVSARLRSRSRTASSALGDRGVHPVVGGVPAGHEGDALRARKESERRVEGGPWIEHQLETGHARARAGAGRDPRLDDADDDGGLRPRVLVPREHELRRRIARGDDDVDRPVPVPANEVVGEEPDLLLPPEPDQVRGLVVDGHGGRQLGERRSEAAVDQEGGRPSRLAAVDHEDAARRPGCRGAGGPAVPAGGSGRGGGEQGEGQAGDGPECTRASGPIFRQGCLSDSAVDTEPAGRS